MNKKMNEHEIKANEILDELRRGIYNWDYICTQYNPLAEDAGRKPSVMFTTQLDTGCLLETTFIDVNNEYQIEGTWLISPLKLNKFD